MTPNRRDGAEVGRIVVAEPRETHELAGPDPFVVAVRAARRDPHAFAPVFDHFHGPVFGYCLRRLRDPDAAADAAMTVFTRALAGAGGFTGGSVAAWLFTIARNVVVDTVRARRPTVPLQDAGEIPDGALAPDDVAIAGEQTRALFAALDALTPEQRHVVELRLAGLTAREVADVLGTTTGAVKASQHRAYARLRVLLADQWTLGDTP